MFDRHLTLKLLELIHMTEGLLEHSVEQGAILSAIIPSYINGEHVEVLVEARQLDDGSPSEDVRVTVRDADGVELGTQHTQVRLLGNAEEIRRALTSGMPDKKRGIAALCTVEIHRLEIVMPLECHFIILHLWFIQDPSIIYPTLPKSSSKEISGIHHHPP